MLYLCKMDWKNYNFKFEGLEAHLERISLKKAKLDSLRPIPSIFLENIKQSLCIEWTYNSNSIEGNTLTLQETKMVIEEGFTIDFVEKLVHPSYVLSAKDILEVHGLVLQKIEKDFAGRYRQFGVRISGANFIPPNALKVNDLMDELVSWVNFESSSLSSIVRSCIFHHRFVWIHPFADGNGRTVRLIFNLLLMKEGYPPAIILRNDRKKYYDALNKANNGDYSKLVLLTLQALERTLDIYLSSLTNTYDDYQPIIDIVNEPGVVYGQEYISLLARKGKIDAFKEGRNWLTSKKAIDEYLAMRKRKRVPNKLKG